MELVVGMLVVLLVGLGLFQWVADSEARRQRKVVQQVVAEVNLALNNVDARLRDLETASRAGGKVLPFVPRPPGPKGR